ncbi:transcription elongation factor 1 homolog [Leuresthes tenuis]
MAGNGAHILPNHFDRTVAGGQDLGRNPFAKYCNVYFKYGKTFPSSRKMGRRKSKRKPPPKKKMTGDLDSQFTCPFCNHEKSCDVKMERSRNTGIISCTVCLEEFQTPITYLSEPVDVYSDWIDACEAANQ